MKINPVEKLNLTDRRIKKTIRGIELKVPNDVRDCWKHLKGRDVFVTVSTLEKLADQGSWDSQFGKVLLLPPDEGLALEAAGLAEQETRGGYHGTDLLRKLMGYG